MGVETVKVESSTVEGVPQHVQDGFGRDLLVRLVDERQRPQKLSPGWNWGSPLELGQHPLHGIIYGTLDTQTRQYQYPRWLYSDRTKPAVVRPPVECHYL